MGRKWEIDYSSEALTRETWHNVTKWQIVATNDISEKQMDASKLIMWFACVFISCVCVLPPLSRDTYYPKKKGKKKWEAIIFFYAFLPPAVSSEISYQAPCWLAVSYLWDSL